MKKLVLILIVVDNSLVPSSWTAIRELYPLVLILIVVDNSLVLDLIRPY